MLKILTEKLSAWKVDSKTDTKADIYDIIETLDALSRAQHQNMTQGMTPEEGSKKASETAMAGGSENQDPATLE